MITTLRRNVFNTLKIYDDEVGVLANESVQAIVVKNDKEIIEENSEEIVTNGQSESDVNDPAVELANDHGVVNINDINERADIPVVENDVELDVRPEPYHDPSWVAQAEIDRLLGDQVNVKSSGNEITWEVIKITPHKKYQRKKRKLKKELKTQDTSV